jgi:hypothetical protein
VTDDRNQQGDGEVGVCHICGVTFPTQQQLVAHLMDDHDGEILPTDMP